MESSGGATIKQRSPSQAPRGRGNPSKQNQHNHRQTTIDKLALSSPNEAMDPLPFTYK